MKKAKTSQGKYPRISIRVSEKLLVALADLAESEQRKPSELARMILAARVMPKRAA